MTSNEWRVLAVFCFALLWESAASSAWQPHHAKSWVHVDLETMIPLIIAL
jgi:hypothetical protein